MYDDDDEPEGPKSSFTTYLSEGNVHFNQGEYKKALDSYTQVYSSNLVDFNEIFFDQKHLRFSRISWFIRALINATSLLWKSWSLAISSRLKIIKQNYRLSMWLFKYRDVLL